jgi:hypothetical protein
MLLEIILERDAAGGKDADEITSATYVPRPPKSGPGKSPSPAFGRNR